MGPGLGTGRCTPRLLPHPTAAPIPLRTRIARALAPGPGGRPLMPADKDLFTEERHMVTMSFGDHLEELRVRLILALLGLVVGIIITFIPPFLGRLVMIKMEEPASKALKQF